jgi:hypothetical protein
MKAKILYVFSLLYLSVSFLPSAAQIYKSENFENQGVSEYIQFTMLAPLAYWTSQNSQKIMLEVREGQSLVDMTQQPFDVNFPGSKQIYKLSIVSDKLLCVHPDGRKQWFTYLPLVYQSKNFEQQGVTEYLQLDKNGQYLYFTNQTLGNKVSLQTVSPQNTYPTKVKFPNDSKVYRFDFMPACFGDLICTHPDGRKQVFSYYFWDEELK